MFGYFAALRLCGRGVSCPGASQSLRPWLNNLAPLVLLTCRGNELTKSRCAFGYFAALRLGVAVRFFPGAPEASPLLNNFAPLVLFHGAETITYAVTCVRHANSRTRIIGAS